MYAYISLYACWNYLCTACRSDFFGKEQCSYLEGIAVIFEQPLERTNAWTGFISTVARGLSFQEQESVADYCKRPPLWLQLHGRVLPSAHLNPEWVKTLMLLLGVICLCVYTGCCWAKTSREEVHSSTEAVWALQGRFQQGFVWPQYVYVYKLHCALCTTHLIIKFAILKFPANCTKVLGIPSTGFLKWGNVFLT